MLRSIGADLEPMVFLPGAITPRKHLVTIPESPVPVKKPVTIPESTPKPIAPVPTLVTDTAPAPAKSKLPYLIAGGVVVVGAVVWMVARK
jgi:hypothetical protein